MSNRPMTEAERALVEAGLRYNHQFPYADDAILDAARAVRAEREEAARPNASPSYVLGFDPARGDDESCATIFNKDSFKLVAVLYGVTESQAIACKDALAREAGEQS